MGRKDEAGRAGEEDKAFNLAEIEGKKISPRLLLIKLSEALHGKLVGTFRFRNFQ